MPLGETVLLGKRSRGTEKVMQKEKLSTLPSKARLKYGFFCLRPGPHPWLLAREDKK